MPQTEQNPPLSQEELAMEELVNAVSTEAFGGPGEVTFDIVSPIANYLERTGADEEASTAAVANDIFEALVVSDEVITARFATLLRFCMRTAREHGKLAAV